MEWEKDGFIISDCKDKIDFEKICSLLGNTYWAKDRPAELIRKSIDNSLCFSILNKSGQIGFGRVVTDYSVFAWIADIIIDPEFRGLGLGKFLMETIINHPLVPKNLQLLKTKDAHGLYEQFGFSNSDCMEKRNKPASS